MGRSRGVREERTEHTQLFSRSLAGFGLTWHQKVHFSTFYGKLEFQCIRNGPQNPPYCPWSIQDTFIIYSSTSHQHIFQKHFPKITILENRKSGKSQNAGSLTGAQSIFLQTELQRNGKPLFPKGPEQCQDQLPGTSQNMLVEVSNSSFLFVN